MYLSDMHTHSIASGHGTVCTISEMVKKAAQQKLKLMGITDHGPATMAAGTPSYFRNLSICPRKRFGVEVLYGIELNILDTEGSVDLEEDLLSRLDYAIASIHCYTYPRKSKEENTRAYLNVMKNPHVKILGHCDNPKFPADYDTIVRHAKENGVILEINEASLAPYGYRGDTRANSMEILQCCRKYKLPILLSSDSHGTKHIGDFTYSADMVHQAMFPESMILNNQIPRLKVFLQTR